MKPWRKFREWWTNPVCHGETGFASWDYQLWLEAKVAKGQRAINRIGDVALISDNNWTDFSNVSNCQRSLKLIYTLCTDKRPYEEVVRQFNKDFQSKGK